ncbi:hypothetical protein F4780DRAFT_783539 [Xylariomycetidae sp. FL0641]|nr:hypothetical protein F4780DRAFT_783539 [Xylariomycetidae sp. FL0641]
MTKAILVTGATGKQGGAVIDALLQNPDTSGFTILAVTRSPSSSAAQTLAARSPQIKLIEGDLDDVPSIFARAQQIAPVWGVYSVQVSMGKGVTKASEIAQGRALIDAALRSGTVAAFVYSSVERGGDAASWANATPIPHFQSKYEIERYLRAAAADADEHTGTGGTGNNMAWTVLRPVAFMDNLAPGTATGVFLAALRNWCGDEGRPVQWVATRDVGVFAALAFADPAAWDRRAVGLAGDELTCAGLARAFRRATGAAPPRAPGFLGSLLTCLVAELRLMIAWFASDGYRADVPARRRDHPGLLSLEQWLVEVSPFESSRARS